MKDERLYLIQMLERAERIFGYTTGGEEEFLKDPKTQDAVIRSFEVMGEAAKRVPQSIRDLAPDIPWRRLAGFRDVLISQASSRKAATANRPGILKTINRL